MDETPRILVIEDDPILRDLMADWLTAAGYRVEVAADGGAGLAAAKAHPPALVVTDINMPGIGGAAVIAEITRAHPGTPIIAVSAHFRAERGFTVEDAKSLGATRTLAKPFCRKDMVGTVTDLLGSARG
jgi:two-component system response regulator FlrC